MSEIKSQKINGNVEVTFIPENSQWEKEVKRAKNNLFQKLELKGFRPGKVPTQIAEKSISKDQIRQEAMNQIIDIYFEKVQDELYKHEIVSKPMLEVVKITDEQLEIKFIATLMPEIILGDYKNLDVKLSTSEVTTEEIEDEIKQITNSFKKTINLTNDDKIEMGHNVDLNFLGTVEGKEFEGGKAENFDLKIGSKSFIDNFEEQLIGHKINDEFIVNVTFPETYPEENLKNKNADFAVKINGIKKEASFEGIELQDKLAKMGFSSMNDLTIRVEKMIKEQKVQTDKDKFFDEIVVKISELSSTKIDIPEELIIQENERSLKNFENNLTQQGINLEQYLKMLSLTNEQFIEKNIVPMAKKQIISGLIYSKLIKEFELEISDDEITLELEKLSKENDISIEDVEKQISKDRIKSSLEYDKLIGKFIKK
ncbi:MAG: trigger factor [Mycoplasmataceae bacterium]|nr:trigger factor [Mycoplasmataceae bacterium]